MHDASNLVCKRRKLPHTELDIWKLWKFSNPCQCFTDPLIPCMVTLLSLCFEASYHPISHNFYNFINELVYVTVSSSAPEKLPQKELSLLSGKSADGVIDSTDVRDGMPEHLMQKMGEISHCLLKGSAVDHRDPINMEDSTPHINTASVKEVLMQKPDITCLTPSKTSDCRPNSLENVSKEFISPDAVDCQLVIMAQFACSYD